MLFFCTMSGTTFSYEFKTIGLSVGISDNLLTWAGSLAALLQAVTRLVFGSLYDKYGFKRLFYIIIFVNLVNSIVCYHTRYIPALYFICILMTYWVFAGIFSIFPAPAS